MKINLIIDNNQVLTSYVNINPLTQDLDEYLKGHNTIIRDDISCLDKYVDDGEAEEIRSVCTINTFMFDAIPNILRHWASKIKHGGRLSIIAPDFQRLTKRFIQGYIPLADMNKMLNFHCRAALTLSFLDEQLRNIGFNIVTKRFDESNFIIIGERP